MCEEKKLNEGSFQTSFKIYIKSNGLRLFSMAVEWRMKASFWMSPWRITRIVFPGISFSEKCFDAFNNCIPKKVPPFLGLESFFFFHILESKIVWMNDDKILFSSLMMRMNIIQIAARQSLWNGGNITTCWMHSYIMLIPIFKVLYGSRQWYEEEKRNSLNSGKLHHNNAGKKCSTKEKKCKMVTMDAHIKEIWRKREITIKNSLSTSRITLIKKHCLFNSINDFCL